MIAKLKDALKCVAIIGAAGKMGRGIALLLLQEMTIDSIGSSDYRLYLIDSNENAFNDLKAYLKTHLIKYAEKNINFVRSLYDQNPLIISNEDVIKAFVEQGMNLLYFTTAIQEAKDAHLIFEAIIEDIPVKVNLFTSLAKLCQHNTLFLSNTSSIPITLLEEKSGLKGQLIGFHFYNPPHIQRLVEVIYPKHATEEQKKLAAELGKRLKKVLVESKDVAGFIGNGHFIREAAFAAQKVDELAKTMAQTDAIYLVNQVTQDYLLRPMGIFQLLDYVGIDVAKKIGDIMKVKIPLIDQMIRAGILGGQFPDGSQKDGFFKYKKNAPTEIYDLKSNSYIPLPQISLKQDVNWKQLVHDAHKKEKLKLYFQNLQKQTSKESELAKAFLHHSKQIGQQLVQEGICHTEQDLNLVLENGFYHLYGPNDETIS